MLPILLLLNVISKEKFKVMMWHCVKNNKVKEEKKNHQFTHHADYEE